MGAPLGLHAGALLLSAIENLLHFHDYMEVAMRRGFYKVKC
jgi:hypothetical protein